MNMSSTNTTNEPAVWLACLRSYSSRDLVGRCVPAVAAATTTVAELHEGTWIDPWASCAKP